MLTVVHILCSRSVLHQTIANERSLVGLNKRICEQYDAKLATARRVGTKMAANCVVADLFGLPNGVNDALFSTILVTNINYEQRSTLSRLVNDHLRSGHRLAERFDCQKPVGVTPKERNFGTGGWFFLVVTCPAFSAIQALRS